MHCVKEKKLWRAVVLVGQHDARLSSRQARQVFRGIATAWTGVDMFTSLFPEVVTEIEANPEHKRLNLYARSLLLLRRPPRWNKHGTTRTTSSARRACRVVTQQVELCALFVKLWQRWRQRSVTNLFETGGQRKLDVLFQFLKSQHDFCTRKTHIRIVPSPR